MPISQRAVVGAPNMYFFVSWFVVGYYSVPSEINSVFLNLFAGVT